VADGRFWETRNLYGIGAHDIHDNVFDGAESFALLQPSILLVDGDGPDAPFAGVSFNPQRET